MMYRAALIAFGLFSGSAFAASEPIAVSAGEHPTFSRVAFAKTTSSIDVRQEGRAVFILNIDPGRSYLLDDINRFDKAHRVSEAKLTNTDSGAALVLYLNCDCRIESVVSGSGKLIVDIFDGKPATLASEAAPELPSKKPQNAQADTPIRATDALSKTDRLSIEQAHEQMVSLLEQAANEGLVTIKGAEKPSSNDSKNQSAARDDESDAANNSDTERSGEIAELIAATEEAEVAPTKPTDLKCIPNSALAIDGDAFSDDPITQIAFFQAALANAPSKQKNQTMRQLAEGYLSIGFGDEALALLESYGQTQTLLADIARIVAERKPAEESALVYAKSCDGAHALWQMVEIDTDDFANQYARTNGALLQLPTRLRVIIASRLALKAVSHEAWAEAEELMEIAKSATNAAMPELDFVEAMLNQKKGDAKSSRLALQRIAAQNSSATDDALLALADSYSQDGIQPHQGFAEDIGALARVTESTKAAIIESSTWAKAENYDAALMLLRGVAETSPDDLSLARASALQILDAALSETPNTRRHIAAIDALLVNGHWLDLEGIEPQRLLHYSRIARRQGLPNLAHYLATLNAGDADADYNFEAASSAMEAGLADDAIRLSAPHANDSRFREIVTKVNMDGGDYHAALATAATIDDENTRAIHVAEAGWLSRSWSSALRGSQAINPGSHNKATALRYAMSAYMEGNSVLPPIVETIFGQAETVIVEGLKSFFAKPSDGSALERSRQSVDSATSEILFIEKVLNDG